MEKNKKSRNVYSFISLFLMILAFILVLNGCVIDTNLILAILSAITGITGIVFSIIGIVKAVKLKKEMGKLKGIVISIISLLLTLCILAIAILIIPILIYEQQGGDTSFSEFVKGSSLTEDEKILGRYIKHLKNSLYDIDSFKLNNVYTYKYNDGGDTRLKAVIDYSGKNLVGGVARNFIVFTYTYEDGYTSINRVESLKEAEEGYLPSIQKKVTIDTKKILKYADEATTPELEVDYDAEEVQKKLTNAVKGMGR